MAASFLFQYKYFKIDHFLQLFVFILRELWLQKDFNLLSKYQAKF